jgi:hypothetical protein
MWRDQSCLICVLDVTVVRDGWCDEETELVEQLKDVLMTVVSHFVREYRQELIAKGVSESLLELFLQLGESSREEGESGENDDDDDDDDDGDDDGDDDEDNDDSDDSEEDTNYDK